MDIAQRAGTGLPTLARPNGKLGPPAPRTGPDYAKPSPAPSPAPKTGPASPQAKTDIAPPGSTITPRTNREGTKSVEVTRPDGTKIDISSSRVKESTPVTHPKAPPETMQRTSFTDSLPGSKGYKRAPTQAELDFLGRY